MQKSRRLKRGKFLKAAWAGLFWIENNTFTAKFVNTLSNTTSGYPHKALVTGATGLVGLHLVKKLLADGYAVRALYRTTHPEITGVEWVGGDILDVVAIEEALKDRDTVFHCAGVVSFHAGNKEELNKTNISGTANMVNLSLDAGIRKFIYVSSVAAIGEQDNSTVTEEMPWRENEHHTPYALSKHNAELEVWRGICEGLPAVIVNPTIILGAGDWTKGSTKVFQRIYSRFPYYTNGVHGFVDVVDLVDIMAALAMRDDLNGQRFIINAANISYKKLFDLIATAFQRPLPDKKVSPFMAAVIWRLSVLKGWLTRSPSLLTRDTAHIAQSAICYDNGKIKNALPDFRFRPLEESIPQICAALREKYHLS